MTDFEKLKDLLDGWGVPFEQDYRLELGEDVGHVVVVEEGCDRHLKTKKVTGWGYFYTLFEFSENGEFLRMGAWE